MKMTQTATYILEAVAHNAGDARPSVLFEWLKANRPGIWDVRTIDETLQMLSKRGWVERGENGYRLLQVLPEYKPLDIPRISKEQAALLGAYTGRVFGPMNDIEDLLSSYGLGDSPDHVRVSLLCAEFRSICFNGSGTIPPSDLLVSFLSHLMETVPLGVMEAALYRAKLGRVQGGTLQDSAQSLAKRLQ